MIDKFEATLSLLNSLAVCKMHLREWDEAEKLLLQAQSKNVNDADTLINMVTCYAHMGKDEQVIERLQKQMYGQHPNHPYTLKMKKAEAEFDVLAKKYADEAGIDPDDPHGNGNDPQRKPKA